MPAAVSSDQAQRSHAHHRRVLAPAAPCWLPWCGHHLLTPAALHLLEQGRGTIPFPAASPSPPTALRLLEQGGGGLAALLSPPG